MTEPAWRLVEGLELADLSGAFSAWNELWVGASLAHDRFLKLRATHEIRDGALSARWTILNP